MEIVETAAEWRPHHTLLTQKNTWILCGGFGYAYFVPCFVGDRIEIEQIAAERGHPHAL